MRLLTLLTLAVLLCGCCKKEVQHVILIGVDGMTVDGLQTAPTPTMDSLIKSGSHTLSMRCMRPSNSVPNWVSMLCGATPEMTGVLSNEWHKDSVGLKPTAVGVDGIFPTIFSIVKASPKALSTASICGSKGFAKVLEPSYIDYNIIADNEEGITPEAVKIIKEKQPSFTFVRYGSTDKYGHKYDFDSEQYYETVTKIDSYIKDIVDAASSLENCVIIITSDHGGIRDGHGGNTPQEHMVPFIIIGKDNIKKGLKIEDQIYTPDVAATIAWALGCDMPYYWVGRPAISAFNGQADKAKDVVATLWNMDAPEITPRHSKYGLMGGLFVDTKAEVTITPPMQESDCQIRYTLDGTTPNENSPLYSAPFTLDKSTIVVARCFDSNKGGGRISRAYFTIVPSNSGHGLTATFYPSNGQKWMKLPPFKGLKPLKSYHSYEFRVDKSIIEPLVEQSGSRTFAISYEGYIDIEKTGNYKFFLESDDGSNLYINDKLIVDNDGDHGVRTRSDDCDLEKGRHKIRVDLLNVNGDYHLELLIKPKGEPIRLVQTDMLYPKN